MIYTDRVTANTRSRDFNKADVCELVTITDLSFFNTPITSKREHPTPTPLKRRKKERRKIGRLSGFSDVLSLIKKKNLNKRDKIYV